MSGLDWALARAPSRACSSRAPIHPWIERSGTRASRERSLLEHELGGWDDEWFRWMG
jgi:hypothetical protein